MRNLLNVLLLTLFAGAIFTACKSEPKPEEAETGEATQVEETDAATGTSFMVKQGVINWEGTKPVIGTKHTGTVNVKGGEFKVVDGNIVSGTFNIDMNSINNQDLADAPGKKEKLEGHLKSPDFFAVDSFPSAAFQITGSEKVEGQEDRTHNISGNLTMRGVEKSITFPAYVKVEGEELMATTPKFSIDRTNWGVNFNASVMNVAKDALIRDDIAVTIELNASKM